MRQFFLSLLLISVLIIACKTDVIDDNSASQEEIYFEDYESPEQLWGYIDTNGIEVIPKIYDDLRPFESGLAIANLKGKWGFINKNGDAKIPHIYRAAFPYRDGLARIQNFDKKYGFIDKNGIKIITDTFGLVFDFDSNRARVKRNENYGYIDKSGNIVIEPSFKKCGNFQNGFAIVTKFGFEGLIDTTGTFLIPFESKYSKIYGISDSKILIKKDNNFNFLDFESPNTISESYENASEFHNDIAAVKINGSWNFIDKSYKIVNKLPYNSIKYANENRWIVENKGKYGIIDSQAKEIVNCQYKLIFQYDCGFAPFQDGELWGYLDLEGKIKMEAILPLAWEFENDFARIITKGKIGYINKTMDLAFPKLFDDGHNFSEGLAHVQ